MRLFIFDAGGFQLSASQDSSCQTESLPSLWDADSPGICSEADKLLAALAILIAAWRLMALRSWQFDILLRRKSHKVQPQTLLAFSELRNCVFYSANGPANFSVFFRDGISQ